MSKIRRLKTKRLKKKIALCLVVVIATLGGVNGELLGSVTNAYKTDVKASSLQIQSQDMTEITKEPESSQETVTPAPEVTTAAAVTTSPGVTGNGDVNEYPKGETTSPASTEVPIISISNPTPVVLNTDIPETTEFPDDEAHLPITDEPTKEPEKTNLCATMIPEPNATAPSIDISGGTCDCVVNYVLNGGTNSDKNPSHVYSSGYKLYSPSKAGYKFVGWYKESLCIHKTTLIDPQGKSEVTYYAKWKKVVVAQAVILKVTRLKSGKIKVKVKNETGVSGYQYMYSIYANMSPKSFVVSSKNPKILSKTKKKCSYYIMVRIYKLDSCKRRIYGKYSKIKLIKK